MPKTTNKYATDSEFVSNLKQDITAFIKAGTEQTDTEDKFNELVLLLFEYQYHANKPYHKYCQKRGVAPGDIDSWDRIPFVAVNAFKEVPLCTFPPEEAVKMFVSSGTTNPEKRSKVYVDKKGMEIMDLSFKNSIETYFYKSPDEKIPTLLVSPSPEAFPVGTSLMMYLSISIVQDHREGELEFFINRQGLDGKGLIKRLRQGEETGKPIWLGGPTFGLVHFYDYCLENDIRFKLPRGSRIIDGAGYKGKSRVMTKKEYYDLSHEITGIDYSHLINNYSMSEIHAIFSDNVMHNHTRGIEAPRYKFIPPWTRVVVVDPETLQPLPEGKQGLIRHYCLANFNTVMAVQTDDLGYQIKDGFEVVGRAKGAEARGCSIIVDELLSAQVS